MKAKYPFGIGGRRMTVSSSEINSVCTMRLTIRIVADGGVFDIGAVEWGGTFGDGYAGAIGEASAAEIADARARAASVDPMDPATYPFSVDRAAKTISVHTTTVSTASASSSVSSSVSISSSSVPSTARSVGGLVAPSAAATDNVIIGAVFAVVGAAVIIGAGVVVIPRVCGPKGYRPVDKLP